MKDRFITQDEISMVIDKTNHLIDRINSNIKYKIPNVDNNVFSSEDISNRTQLQNINMSYKTTVKSNIDFNNICPDYYLECDNYEIDMGEQFSNQLDHDSDGEHDICDFDDDNDNICDQEIMDDASCISVVVGDQNNIVKGGDSETGYSFFDKDSVALYLVLPIH